MQKVIMVCGVPGSGKSWVCEQLQDVFNYVPHDDFVGKNYPAEIFRATREDLPVLIDCPFAERKLREDLIAMDLNVTPVFIIEAPEVVKKRYEKREERTIPKAHLTRSLSILDRAIEWSAFWGTAEEVLKHLQTLS